MPNTTILPALIDPHVHFRIPGAAHKEDWITGAQGALHGGVSTVFEVANTIPPTTTKELLEEKKKLIQEQLAIAGIPLRYYLYLGASKKNIGELERCRADIIGVKLFMGSSTGNLLIPDEDTQRRVFKECARLNLVLAVHAEDEEVLQANMKKLQGRSLSVRDHSKIRNPEVATTALKKIITCVREYGTRTYVFHVSTAAEVALIRHAKKESLPLFCEATPHHLFLNTHAYKTLGTYVQMNPPLRDEADQQALWEALQDGTIDAVGSDHAPHTRAEKEQPYGKAPSGVPGIETTLPLLLTAVNDGRLTIEQLRKLTSENIQSIFNVPPSGDTITVDWTLKKPVEEKHLQTKCGWSPFSGWALTGWPVAMTLQGKTYSID